MTTETPSTDAPRKVSDEIANCTTCGVRFLKRKSWQECCSDRCRRAGTKKITVPVRLAIVSAIRLLEREAVLRRTSIEGGWEEFEEHARVLREYVGVLPE